MNHAVIMGRLTRDPEVRSTQSGKAVARYTLAVDRRTSGDQAADFIPCVAFDRAAEFAQRYFTKGQRVLVSGRIQTDSYTNREGQRVNTTEVIVMTQEFADSKGQAAPAPKADEGGFVAADPVDDPGLPWNS